MMIEVTIYQIAMYLRAVNTLHDGGFLSPDRAKKLRRLIIARYLDEIHVEGGDKVGEVGSAAGQGSRTQAT